MIKTIKKFNDESFQRLYSVANNLVRDDTRPVTLFLFSIFFYIFYLLLIQTDWVLGGEMWAEMATNYFPNANSQSLLHVFFSLDAGYIPFPQRIIAFVGNKLNLSAATIPYFYTWLAIVLTGLMVSVFCLSRFRILIQSDSLRFLTAISILVCAEFETRTFINFTYFAAFFAATITALALANDSEEVPWWAWFIPIMMISKPAVLVVLPSMILVSAFSNKRFRWITIASLVLATFQLIQMLISMKSGVMYQSGDITYFTKFITSLKYFVGFLGGYFLGRPFQDFPNFLMLAGVLIFGFSGYVLFKIRHKSVSLIFIGFSMLFFNVILNTIALGNDWNVGMSQLVHIPIERHITVGFFGFILALSALISIITNNDNFKPFRLLGKNSGTKIFLFWFVASAWLPVGIKKSFDPVSPTINNSQWQLMASDIDAGISPLCVPIDPWWKGSSWIYQRNCTLLKPAPVWDDGFISIRNRLFVDLAPPSSLFDKTILSAAVQVKPFSNLKTYINVELILKLTDGNNIYFSGAKVIKPSGGLILLTGKKSIPMRNISSVRLIFNAPVDIAISAVDPVGTPGIAWMGY